MLWDIQALQPVCGSPTSPEFTSCVSFFSNDSSRIITAGVNNLNIWEVDLVNRKLLKSDIQTGTLRRTFTSVACSQDDEFMYCGTRTGDILQVGKTKHLLDDGCNPPQKNPR